jgi:EpsI family protein
MNNIAIRLYAVVALVMVSYGGARVAQSLAEPPEVELPDWSLADLPMQLGRWQGEITHLDPEITRAVGAKVIVDHVYRGELGDQVAVHTAMFENPAEGVYHSPLNCYRSAGWTKLSETREDIPISDGQTIAVSLTTWEKEGEKILVVYWYQLGKHVLYGRFDLGAFRWAMRGAAKWPVLFKTMLQTSGFDSKNSKAAILDMAQQIGTWLNQPEHRRYLDRW